jgi:hypothetical protein
MEHVTPYEHDIFISYAHIDDTPLMDGEVGWVSEFHRALDSLIKQILGEEPTIWRDPKLQGNDIFSDKLVDTLPKAAVLVSIVSPRYVKSEWCLKELETFSGAAEPQADVCIADKSRVFKVVKTLVPHEIQPAPLDKLLGYEFFHVNPDTGKPNEFRIEFGPEAKQNYLARLYDLAYEITEFLKCIKKTGVHQVQASVKEPVFLAETSSDLIDKRDRVKSELRQLGYAVLPDQQLPYDGASLHDMLQADLERSALSIHLVGASSGFTPEGEKRSVQRLQNDIAAETSKSRGLPRLIWIPADSVPQDDRQEKFIDHLENDPKAQLGADVMRTSLEELKTIVIEKLEGQKVPASDNSSESDLTTRIYLVCDQHDFDAASKLDDYLYDQEFEVFVPVFEGSETEVREDHMDKLLSCDAIIIYQGEATDLWLSSKLRDLRKLPGYDGFRPKLATAIYAGPPDSPHKERLRSREATIIKNFQSFSAEALKPFMAAIEAGRKEAANEKR